MEIVRVFRARVVDLAPNSLIIEITGAEEKIRRPGEDVCARSAFSKWCAPASGDDPRRATRRTAPGKAAQFERRFGRLGSFSTREV